MDKAEWWQFELVESRKVNSFKVYIAAQANSPPALSETDSCREKSPHITLHTFPPMKTAAGVVLADPESSCKCVDPNRILTKRCLLWHLSSGGEKHRLQSSGLRSSLGFIRKIGGTVLERVALKIPQFYLLHLTWTRKEENHRDACGAAFLQLVILKQ